MTRSSAPALSIQAAGCTHLARQAIFDRELNVTAYELLYRGCRQNKSHFLDGDRATGDVVLQALMGLGLERVIGHTTAFINVTPSFVLDGFCEVLPPDRVVLEVLEDIEPTEEILSALGVLSRQGYRIALDDFVLEDRLNHLVHLADIIKIDVASTDREMLSDHVAKLRRFDVELVAEKVETPATLQLCQELGFDYFQGHFLCLPQMISHRPMYPNGPGTMQLLDRLHDESLQLSELEQLISRDPVLCVKLLKFVGSNFFGMPNQIESIRHAAGLIGLKQVRLWAALLAFGEFSDQPGELVRIAQIRARMCERLAAHVASGHSDSCFTVGLLSLLEAFTNAPLTEILEQLPLSQEVKTALLQREGLAGRILEMVTAYEQGSGSIDERINVPSAVVRSAYLDALQWADDCVAQLQN